MLTTALSMQKQLTTADNWAHLCINSTVFVFQADNVVLGPNEEVGVDARHNIDEGPQGQDNVGEEDNTQGQLQAQTPPGEPMPFHQLQLRQFQETLTQFGGT